LKIIQFDCYFDASFSLKNNRGGFYILKENSLEKQSVRTLGAKTSDMAEAEILHKLLDYIQLRIEHRSKVCIYGDAQGLILSILGEKKVGRDRYKSLRKKYHKMREYYELSIEFIPRRQNSYADALAKNGL